MAPEIFYAEDTDGDGDADVRQTLYKGFAEGNQQHRVNGLRWGWTAGWTWRMEIVAARLRRVQVPFGRAAGVSPPVHRLHPK